MTNDDTKMPKNAEKFECKKCYFVCSKQSNYFKHISTRKHENNVKWMTNDDKKMPKNAGFFECVCGKVYTYRQGLWKHQQKCEFVLGNINSNANNIFDYLKSENAELKKMILEIVKSEKQQVNNIITNHNKTFNLNLFLNETCKDAMNIMDFVNSIDIKLSDLENVGKSGFVNGISNIIVENLKALDIHKRPLHCSDSKREIMYIKDADKWEKDNIDKNKLRNAIKHVAHKNSKIIPKFKAKYPDCIYSESKKSNQYNKMIIEVMGGIGNDDQNETKIIKKIAKEVIINKDD
jgi:hypothetical protein